MEKVNRPIILFLLLFMPAGTLATANAQQFTDKVKKPVEESVTIRRHSQKDAEKWSLEKSALESDYDSLLENRKRLTFLRDQLTEQIGAKEQSIASLEKQIASAKEISERLMPFLERTRARLNDLLDDSPRFLMEERTMRCDSLEKTIRDPQITLGEKFRKVMEALYIEVEYGNTVEVYQEKIVLEDAEVLVNVLRVGRAALCFETLDQKTCGYCDIATDTWQRLPQNTNGDIHAAMEIGSKRRPADIVNLPLGKIITK